MGVLRKLEGDEIMAIVKLTKMPNFESLRGILADSLAKQREQSDTNLNWEEELVSKGARQALAEILNLTDSKSIDKVFQRFRKGTGV
jgi:hypothetical protein